MRNGCDGLQLYEYTQGKRTEEQKCGRRCCGRAGRWKGVLNGREPVVPLYLTPARKWTLPALVSYCFDTGLGENRNIFLPVSCTPRTSHFLQSSFYSLFAALEIINFTKTRTTTTNIHLPRLDLFRTTALGYCQPKSTSSCRSRLSPQS